MSYRFEANESVAEAVARIAGEQLDQALEHTNAKGKLDDAVHDVRVCFKKLRALIRLASEGIGDKEYKRANVFYRDLNRRLSEVRDTAALTEILEKLKRRFAAELSADAFASFSRSLTRATRKRQADKKKVLTHVGMNSITAQKRIKKWSIEEDDFAVVGDGLTRTYARGRAGFKKAYAKPSVKALHEWRKEVKYLWYHVGLLRKLWPKPLKGFAKQIENLVDHLSDDHDLAMLRKRVLEDSDESGDRHEDEALMALIDKRRAELQLEARFLGERIYAEKPDVFKSRFHEYWRAWRSEQKADPLAAT